MGTVKKEKDDVKITLKYHPSAYPQHPLGLNKCQSQALTFTDSERERRQGRVYGMVQEWGMTLSHEFLFSPSKPACIKGTVN